MDIGQRIAELRRSKGLTQSELGRRIKRSRSLVSRLESGAVTPNYTMLRALAEAFDIPVTALLADDPPEQRKPA